MHARTRRDTYGSRTISMAIGGSYSVVVYLPSSVEGSILEEEHGNLIGSVNLCALVIGGSGEIKIGKRF